MEVSESAIEAEDGCCPECGAMIGAASSFLDDPEETDDMDYDAEDRNDVFSDLDDEDDDNDFARADLDDDDIFSDDDLDGEFSDEEFEDEENFDEEPEQ